MKTVFAYFLLVAVMFCIFAEYPTFWSGVTGYSIGGICGYIFYKIVNNKTDRELEKLFLLPEGFWDEE